tara:strand:- start:422 stop:916 length:495 start_codon:yes stop_codon:yes gene_type:complete
MSYFEKVMRGGNSTAKKTAQTVDAVEELKKSSKVFKQKMGMPPPKNPHIDDTKIKSNTEALQELKQTNARLTSSLTEARNTVSREEFDELKTLLNNEMIRINKAMAGAESSHRGFVTRLLQEREISEIKKQQTKFVNKKSAVFRTKRHKGPRMKTTSYKSVNAP